MPYKMGTLSSFPLGSGETFEKMDPVYLSSGISKKIPSSGNLFAGFATKKTDESLGHSRVEVEQGNKHGFAVGSLVDADINEDIYLTSAGLLSKTSSGNVKIGVLNEIENGLAWVKLELYNAVQA